MSVHVTCEREAHEAIMAGELRRGIRLLLRAADLAPTRADAGRLIDHAASVHAVIQWSEAHMQIARLVVTLDDSGVCEVEGQGAAVGNKAMVYGLLELAKDVVRQGSKVEPATRGDLQRLTQ